MAADLDFGTVPPLYLEVLNILESLESGPLLSQEYFYVLLQDVSGLSKTILSQVWNLCITDPQGTLKRTGIIKALALVAFAQQGKTLTEKLILNFSGEALPVPQVGDIHILRSNFLRAKMKKSGTGYTLADIFALDSVDVQLVPEKKGLFLKHVEYEITSQKYKSTVKRRYNDFIAFHDILVIRFPFRLVPNLPPKRLMGGDAEFLEERRKSLKRFLNLIARHPILMEDRTVQFFMTFVGTDVQHKIKDYTKNIPEEAEPALMVDTMLSHEGDQAELAVARERLKQVHLAVTNLRIFSQRMVDKVEESRDDVLNIGKEFSALSRFIPPPVIQSDPAKQVLEQLYNHFSAISTTTNQQAQLENEEVVERQDLLLDLLSAYKELGERYDSVLSQDISAQMGKRVSLRRSTSSPSGFPDAQSPGSPTFESRRVQALQSLIDETRLVQTYLELLWVLLQSLVTIRSTWIKKTGNLWDKMLPLVDGLQMSDYKDQPKSPDSPTR